MMRATPTTFTVAEYCNQMHSGAIYVDRDYQRSPRVWPAAARSFLIETILLGYPMPKLCLNQETDLRTRTTKKAIVDGQQRSQAILDFFDNRLAISTRSDTDFAGCHYKDLDENAQQAFLSYLLSVDLFVGSGPVEIREVFRRINSYTVPLNPQEKRHAKFQGAFKWFVASMTRQYSQALKDMGVFTETQLNRMADAQLLSEICESLVEGVANASEPKIDAFYKDREDAFPEQPELAERLTGALDTVAGWRDFHSGQLTKPYNFYSLILAVTHAQHPCAKLSAVYPRTAAVAIDEMPALYDLTRLADILDQGVADPASDEKELVDACSSGTNRIKQREARLRWLSRALDGTLHK